MLCKTSSAVLVELPLATPLESGGLDYRAGSPMGSNPFYLASLRAELEFYRSTGSSPIRFASNEVQWPGGTFQYAFHLCIHVAVRGREGGEVLSCEFRIQRAE